MGKFMPSVRDWIGYLAWVGGFVALVDTYWLVMAALLLDIYKTNELVLAISFVLGLPAYLLDLWMDKPIAISMLGLILFRWIALCYSEPTPSLVSPWYGNQLLVVAFVLLQLSKLQGKGKPKPTTHPA